MPYIGPQHYGLHASPSTADFPGVHATQSPNADAPASDAVPLHMEYKRIMRFPQGWYCTCQLGKVSNANEPALAYDPAAHVLHVEDVVAAIISLDLPAAQLVHDVLPVPAAYRVQEDKGCKKPIVV